MKSKTLLTVAILAGLIAVVLVQLHLRGAKGPSIQVFRATESLAPGRSLDGRLETVELPGGNLFPGILKEAPTAEMADFVKTTSLKREIRKGEIVLYRHLESTVDPGIRPSIPAGMKAVSIEVDEVTSVAHFIEPGDLVDILGTVPRDSGTTQPPPPVPRIPDEPEAEEILGLLVGPTGLAPDPARTLVTKPLAQAVRVLAVGGRYKRSDEAVGEPYRTVTLLVTMDEAQKLAFARDVLESRMTLALRPPGDAQEQTDVRSFGLDSADFDFVGNQ